MRYTVKEVSELANVTIKTLHHYHKIGLLLPIDITDAGYRLYGMRELERLQEILFYRELDIPLEEIKKLLNGKRDRIALLSSQKGLLTLRMDRARELIQTIEESIRCAQKGEVMEKNAMFKGFESEEAWREALSEQQAYLMEHYDYDVLADPTPLPDDMNEMAAEAQSFMQAMATALKNGLKANSEQVAKLIHHHVAFLNKHEHRMHVSEFAAQTRFFIEDDFHRDMLESQQIGLSYYLCCAAESAASS